ncbi:FAD/NAD(P)-binding protein [Streptomyces sp. HNM0574]|uniref:FAD/NAD(P)-binding protein n=1 Tax=Streptomyces sp. HNM0574 TaxID=2714954 RepID=UPI00146D693A|nr:FAD/NAD(P)-binding protein [Streptomyces sp. HNM0574]
MAQHHAIAVVGSGPRGASLVERVCASAPRLLPPGDRLTLHVVDPSPPGAGRVWRTGQPERLLMNTVASQVTLFTDDSVEMEGPVRPGPSLHEWHERTASGALGPDDYPSRTLYGRYLEWVFAETVRTAPHGVTVTVHPARAVRLADETGAEHARAGAPLQTLELSDGTRLTGLSAVLLAQGHLPTKPDATERRLAAYARERGLRYLPPANPADVTAALDALAPGRPVLLRGLGLNFFDHMALLTTGRGGRFVREDASGLRYVPSGREPRLLAGSRRGVPYHARGDNEKGAHGRHTPLLLTPEVIADFRRRAGAGDPPDFLRDVWPLVAKEVETVHYAARLADPEQRAAFRARFPRTAHGGAEEAAVLDAFGFARTERWDWDALATPCRPARGAHGAPDDGEFASPEAFRAWLLGVLRRDVAQARCGNVSSPVKAALDVLRDLRNELRGIVDHGGLRGTSRRDHLDRWYTPLNAFLSIGPPRRRVEEMAALMEAGVLDVVGPRLEVEPGPDGFTAHSPLVPGSRVTAHALIEARLPEPSLRRTADPLLRALLESGGCRPHTADGYETDGLDVTPRPFHLVDAQGRAHARRFAVGVPTEGVHWVTAAGARPGVNSVTLTDTDAVARAALRACVPGSSVRAGTPEGARTERQPAPRAGQSAAESGKVQTAAKIELTSVVR